MSKAGWLCVAVVAGVVGALFLPAVARAWGDGEHGSGPKPEKITFVHFRDGHVGVQEAARGGKKGKGDYRFIAKGFRWPEGQDEPFVVNPTNSGLPRAFVLAAVQAGADEWEEYGGDVIFGYVGLGTIEYDDEAADGWNAISFGLLPEGVIGVTTIWGVWWGPPTGRYIAEADILFNTFYAWGDATVDPGVMDLQNIATHELGHAAGMDDLTKRPAFRETMYGFSREGEVSKRDLYLGDIAGIMALYE